MDERAPKKAAQECTQIFAESTPDKRYAIDTSSARMVEQGTHPGSVQQCLKTEDVYQGNGVYMLFGNNGTKTQVWVKKLYANIAKVAQLEPDPSETVVPVSVDLILTSTTTSDSCAANFEWDIEGTLRVYHYDGETGYYHAQLVFPRDYRYKGPHFCFREEKQ